MMKMLIEVLPLVLLLSCNIHDTAAYRIKGSVNETQHFVPYERGAVGNVQQFTTAPTWSNQGYHYAESIVLGDSVGKNRLTSCPQMVGPIHNEYFCRGQEYGYCDRRSGTCFCNEGYMGDACGECVPTHFNVGDVCYPKTLCPNDCSGFGQCDYQTGICQCNEYREGDDCSKAKCSRYHEFCTTCDEDGCIECEDGFSSHKTAEWGEQCQPCWRFDPRCRTCSEDACTSCIDLLLLSIHRSGRRPHDPPLPMDELTRELSITVPFGSKQVDAFYDAEHYFLVDDPSITPLNESAVECHQGLNNDDSIDCMPYNLTSHLICGNHGTITFDSPEYAVREDNKHIRLTLRRSGGGVGEVAVSYSLYPITAGFEDVASTAYYTSNRTVVFRQGQITASFLVTINDDRMMEPNETFSVHLSNPTGGASLGTQQRTIVTIIDDDSDMSCAGNVEASLGTNNGRQSNVGVAGTSFQFDLFANTCSGDVSTGDGDMFKVIARKLVSEESPLEIDMVDDIGHCVHSLENAYACEINATTSGNYELDVYLLIPGGLKGFYFTDNVLDNSRLDMIRTDAVVNFTWGTGPVTTFGRDFVSVRWEGYVRPMYTETYTFWLDVDDHARLWIDGHLLIDWWTFPLSSSMLHAEHNLTEFETHEIILEYRDILGNATARLMWSSESTPIATIPSSSLFYKEPIGDSPFEYVVLPAATDASNSQAVGEDVHMAIAGKQHSFTIVPKDAHNNFRGWPHHSIPNDERHLDAFHATAVLLDVAEGDASFNVDITYDASSRTFVTAYTPKLSGHYHLDVTYEANGNSMHISGSPFSLTVLPGDTFAQESTAFGYALHHGIAGDDETATIQAFDANGNRRDVGGDDWEVTVTSVLTNDYQYGTTLDHGNGTYTLHVVPLVAGPNDLSIRLDGSHIRGSPFRMNVVHNAVDSSSSFVINEAEVSTMTAVRYATIIVQAVDMWGNKAIYSDEEPHNTSVSVQSKDIDASVTKITYRGGGKYEICVMPVLSGEIKLRIMLNGVDILGSPLPVSVHPGDFFAETSVATGVGLMRAQAGVRASFSIQSKDEGGNNKDQDEALFNVTLTLVERASIPVGIEIYGANATDEVVVTGTQSFIEEGRYLIQYTCFEAGQYSLHINDFKGNSIAGSPFSVHVMPGQLSGSHSIFTGEGIVKGTAGQISHVTVFPRDAYQNFIFESQETLEIELTLQSRHQSKWEEDSNQVNEHTIKQLVRANSDGSFRLDYLTAYAGVYSLDVTTFLPGGLEASYFSSPDLAPEHLVFSSIDAYVDKDFGALPFTCNEDSMCVSLGDMAGPYRIGAKWSGKLKADVNEEYEIMVECNDGGHVSFAIAGVYVPWQPCWPYATTSAVLPTKPVDFALRYKNYQGNDPFVTLKWSSPSTGSIVVIPPSNLLSQHILGNTLYPHIYPGVAYAPLSNAIGDSLRHAVSGIEQEFLVESRDVHGNLLLSGDARVVSYGYNKNATIETSVSDNGNGTFVVRYHAGVSGEYLLFVQVGELSTSRPLSHVKDSPFLLTVQPGRSDPKTSILSIDNGGSGVTGRSLISRLQTRDFHRNIRYQGGEEIIAYLSSVEFPTEKYRCQVYDDDSGTYLIECPPQWKEGPYLLDVSIVSSTGVYQPLTSGPFNVTVFPGHAVAATTSVVSGGTPITADSGIPSVLFIGDAGMWSSFVVSARDVFGNYLTTGGNHFVTRVVDNDEAEVQVIDQENGEYIVAYKLPEASAYKFDVGLVTGSGLIGNYYLNETCFVDGVPTKTTIDKKIDFNTWRLDESFSHVTWTGYISFPHNGRFELELTGVEGHFTLFIGSKVVVDSNNGSSIGSFVAMENVLYELKMEYSMDINRLLLKMYWTSAKMSRHIVPGSHYFNATEPIHGSPFQLTIF